MEHTPSTDEHGGRARPRCVAGLSAKMIIRKVTWGGVLLATALAFAPRVEAQDARAEDFPSRPIRIVVPYSPGGGADIVARILAEKLQEKWSRPAVVENRAGAGGNLGAEAVFTAAPDGHTLLFTAQGPLVVNQSLYGK